MTEIEAAYLAGIIDGEGTIMLSRVRSTVYVYPRLKVANTNEALMQWLVAKLGGTVAKHPDPRGKDVYYWGVASNNAIAIIEQVQPYLIVKRQQADVVLALAAENSAARAVLRYIGRGLPDYLHHFREACFLHMKNLNRRGVGPAMRGRDILEHLRLEALSCPSNTALPAR